MSWDDSTTERSTPGRARRGKQHFNPRAQGGPCEAKQDGKDWLALEWGDTTWVRWRKLDGIELWEREQ